MNLLTKEQIEHARRLARLGHTAHLIRPYKARTVDLNAARGILIGMMIGSALWVVIGVVLYFAFFRGM